MWIKYTGEITYNSMQVRGFKPNTSRSLSEENAKYLLGTFPKLFKRSGPPPVKEVIEPISESEPKEEVVEEVPKVEETIVKDAKKDVEIPKKKGRK